MNCQNCQGDGKVVREAWGFNQIHEYVIECPKCGGSGLERCYACGNEVVREDLKMKFKTDDRDFHYFCSEECMKEYV